MILFSNKGRLGNFLFQCACAQAYALDHGLEFSIPDPKKSNFWNPIYLRHLYRPCPVVRPLVLKETSLTYEPIPFKEEWRDRTIILDGYFQSEKYFRHHAGKIIDSWKLNIKTDKGLVGIHVRRGDYLKYPNKHIILTKEWINEAKELFPGYTFKFFSDDIMWCKDNFPQDWHSNEIDPMKDIVSLASCEHQIISPGTFGWWGAELNPNKNKKVVTTQFWFAARHHEDGSGIFQDKWIRL